MLTLVALAACVLALVYRPQRAAGIWAPGPRQLLYAAAEPDIGPTAEPDVVQTAGPGVAPAVTPTDTTRHANGSAAASTTRPTATSPASTPASPGATPPAPAHPAASERRYPYLHETIATATDGRAVVTNPTAIEVVVNKGRYLPDRYVPADLVYPNVTFSFRERIEKRMLRREAAEALEELFADAAREGVKLVGISGYRSYATQRAIFARQVRTRGEREAARVSAYPGQSEHQTGLAIDVSSASVNYALNARFGRSREGRWLADNAHRFGFIIRYPEGREEETGFIYEPWHIRYVGAELAAEIRARGVTLEEFFTAPQPLDRRAEAAANGDALGY